MVLQGQGFVEAAAAAAAAAEANVPKETEERVSSEELEALQTTFLPEQMAEIVPLRRELETKEEQASGLMERLQTTFLPKGLTEIAQLLAKGEIFPPQVAKLTEFAQYDRILAYRYGRAIMQEASQPEQEFNCLAERLLGTGQELTPRELETLFGLAKEVYLGRRSEKAVITPPNEQFLLDAKYAMGEYQWTGKIPQGTALAVAEGFILLEGLVGETGLESQVQERAIQTLRPLRDGLLPDDFDLEGERRIDQVAEDRAREYILQHK
ncbi:hypothetical protein KKB83_03495 [Patescibacteria group bacterium]|nr:hypothetical protein [Patescibacteria group bacterium]